jgi:hypothetical protein
MDSVVLETLILWLLISLSILAAVAVFIVISYKRPQGGYCLGLCLIFLFWHTVAVVTVVAPDAIHCRIGESDPCDGLDILFGDLICLMTFFFTILTAALAGISGWTSGSGETLRPARRSMAVWGLAGSLILLAPACVAGVNWLVFKTTGLYFLEIGYWHWRIVRHGLTPLFVVDGMFLLFLLTWLVSAWIRRKRIARGY